MTPDVRVTLQKLAKVRSLASKHVFLYKGKPIARITTAFKSALKDAGVKDFRFTILGTVQRRIRGEREYQRKLL